MKFDSIREFERWQELALLEKAGVIKDLERQVRMKLTCGGNPILSKGGRQFAYVVDFRYWDNVLNKLRLEEVKGYNTPLGDIKVAMVEAETGIMVEIVR